MFCEWQVYPRHLTSPVLLNPGKRIVTHAASLSLTFPDPSLPFKHLSHQLAGKGSNRWMEGDDSMGMRRGHGGCLDGIPEGAHEVGGEAVSV